MFQQFEGGGFYAKLDEQLNLILKTVHPSMVLGLLRNNSETGFRDYLRRQANALCLQEGTPPCFTVAAI